ncbi:MAG: hypothetical protein OEY16_05070 [Alphaproteobacteria bacterium]|nr:hypothetical protein [Alphaproteobacteria bacterium]
MNIQKTIPNLAATAMALFLVGCLQGTSSTQQPSEFSCQMKPPYDPAGLEASRAPHAIIKTTYSSAVIDSVNGAPVDIGWWGTKCGQSERLVLAPGPTVIGVRVFRTFGKQVVWEPAQSIGFTVEAGHAYALKSLYNNAYYKSIKRDIRDALVPSAMITDVVNGNTSTEVVLAAMDPAFQGLEADVAANIFQTRLQGLISAERAQQLIEIYRRQTAWYLSKNTRFDFAGTYVVAKAPDCIENPSDPVYGGKAALVVERSGQGEYSASFSAFRASFSDPMPSLKPYGNAGKVLVAVQKVRDGATGVRLYDWSLSFMAVGPNTLTLYWWEVEDGNPDTIHKAPSELIRSNGSDKTNHLARLSEYMPDETWLPPDVCLIKY